MRRIEQALVLVLWALLAISPSGCGDEERPDDETDDTDDADGGADAGPDGGWDDDSSGVRGYTSCYLDCPHISSSSLLAEGVHVSSTEHGSDTGAGSCVSDETAYYEIALPPAVYSVGGHYSGSGWDCGGGVSTVVVSAGVWVDMDLWLNCTVFE